MCISGFYVLDKKLQNFYCSHLKSGTQTHWSNCKIAFLPGPQSGLTPALDVGGVGPVLGETVNPLSTASLSNTSNDPKSIIDP